MNKIQGIFFRDIRNDYVANILKELYIDCVYDQFFRGKKDLITIDLGSNVGLFTQYAVPYSKIVYSVEPSLQHFETLNQLITFNNLTNVIPIRKAISNKNGTVTFYHNPNSTAFSLTELVTGQEKEIVESITLEDLFKEQKIDHVDILKIDVEGEELKIIGSSNFDNIAAKIKTIVGEFHSFMGVSPSLLVAALRDRGYQVRQLPTDASVFVAERL